MKSCESIKFSHKLFQSPIPTNTFPLQTSLQLFKHWRILEVKSQHPRVEETGCSAEKHGTPLRSFPQMAGHKARRKAHLATQIQLNPFEPTWTDLFFFALQQTKTIPTLNVSASNIWTAVGNISEAKLSWHHGAKNHHDKRRVSLTCHFWRWHCHHKDRSLRDPGPQSHPAHLCDQCLLPSISAKTDRTSMWIAHCLQDPYRRTSQRIRLACGTSCGRPVRPERDSWHPFL